MQTAVLACHEGLCVTIELSTDGMRTDPRRQHGEDIGHNLEGVVTGKFRKTDSKTMGCSTRCKFEAAKAKNAAAVKKAYDGKTSKWEAEWTGSWPALCYGKWIVRKNGVEVDAGDLPFQGEPAGTLNDYSGWSFTSDWDVEDHTYEDGLGVDEWIRRYGEAIAECLPLDDVDADLRALYWAFNEHDFRPGSCGGCI